MLGLGVASLLYIRFQAENTDIFVFNTMQKLELKEPLCSETSNLFCILDTFFKEEAKNSESVLFNRKLISYQIKDIQTHKDLVLSVEVYSETKSLLEKFHFTLKKEKETWTILDSWIFECYDDEICT